MKDLASTIAKCIDNDRNAQQVLYKAHFNFLMSVCYRYESNQQDAVALVNQVFLKILNNLNSYDNAKDFLPWVKRITINTCIDYLRSKQRLNGQVVFLNEEQWEKEGEQQEYVEDTAADLSYEALLEMLNQLAEPERTVFNLFAIDEYTHKEIANQLGISERTSKRHVQRARMHLQNLLKKRALILKGAS
jgi:RNA polymerase sigma-70 factor (ECF subfamily)